MIFRMDRGPEGDVEAVVVTAVVVFVLGFSTAGALISSRHPSNPVGWICSAVSLLYVTAALADSLVNSYTHSVRTGGPALRLFVTVGESLWSVGLGLGATLLLLLFPNGELPSRRWRPVLWLAAGLLIVLPLALILTPGRVQDAGDERRREHELAEEVDVAVVGGGVVGPAPLVHPAIDVGDGVAQHHVDLCGAECVARRASSRQRRRRARQRHRHEEQESYDAAHRARARMSRCPCPRSGEPGFTQAALEHLQQRAGNARKVAVLAANGIGCAARSSPRS